jgi:hypothetical protein
MTYNAGAAAVLPEVLMIHEHDPHGHAVHAHAADAEFSDSEWQALREEDKKGAMAVVGLMVGIFTIGLVLYLIVALSASS